MNSVGKRRLVIWGGAGLVVAALLVIGLAPRAVPADMETVVEGPLQVVVEHEGITRIRNPFVISAPVDGRVRRIELEPGDPVRADQTVLVTFEPVDPVLLDARSRAEAEAALKTAQAALARSRAERERARATAQLAATELVRTRDLTEQKIVAQQVLDSAEADAEASREALLAAESAVRAAQHELEAAQARLMTPGQDGLGGADEELTSLELRSPVDGVVLRRIRQSAAVVARGEPLLEVADPSDLEIVADFLSTDAVRIKPGMAVLIDRWGGDRVLQARVRRVEPGGFMKISALGVEEQRVNVVADFDDPMQAWETLGDQYRVQVGVVVWESDNVLLVPTSSLFRSGDEWAVYIVDGGKARLRRVEIGHRTGLKAEVLNGLESGQRVVAHPSDAVSDGTRIRPRSE